MQLDSQTGFGPLTEREFGQIIKKLDEVSIWSSSSDAKFLLW